MDHESRLKEILGRQAAEAERKRAADAASVKALEAAALLKEEVSAAWTERQADLESSVREVNELMAGNGRKLFAYAEKETDPRRVARFIVSFNEKSYSINQTMDKMAVTVESGGNVSFHMGTKSMSPKKHYSKNIFDCNKGIMMSAVIDFLDINTPS